MCLGYIFLLYPTKLTLSNYGLNVFIIHIELIKKKNQNHPFEEHFCLLQKYKECGFLNLLHKRPCYRCVSGFNAGERMFISTNDF